MSNKQNTNTQKAKGKVSPKATGKSSSSKKPRVKNVTKSSVAIASSHTLRSSMMTKPIMRTGLKSEMLFTIPGTLDESFQVSKRIRINPLSRETFKWLPSIAQNFESFKFHYMRIRYENRCSATTNGSIILSPSYDAADSAAQAATEALIFNNKGTVDFSVWKSQSLTLNPAALNRLYKSHTCMSDERFANTTQDLKTIDPAQVFICVDGLAPTPSPGKIFLDYDVEFFEPHAPTEPVNMGGAGFTLSTAIAHTSSTPFGISTGDINVVQEAVPVLKLLSQLRDEGLIAAGSTATFAQLTKDWSGPISVLTSGTGLNASAINSIFKSPNPNTAASSAGDVALSPLLAGITTNSTGTLNRESYELVGKAGDFLKMGTTTATAITNMIIQLAGSSVFV